MARGGFVGWIAISLNGGGRFLVDSGGAGVGFFFFLRAFSGMQPNIEKETIFP